MNPHAIGIDLGKTVFHLVGLSQAGEVVVWKKFSRTWLLRFTSNVQVNLIGMEACRALISSARQTGKRKAALGSLFQNFIPRFPTAGLRKGQTNFYRSDGASNSSKPPIPQIIGRRPCNWPLAIRLR